MTERTLPYLPGYNQDPRWTQSKFHKSHLLDKLVGVPQVKDSAFMPKPDARTLSNPENTLRVTGVPALPEGVSPSASLKLSQSTAGLSSVPAWLSYDRKVLRFYAYFQENIVSSSVETARNRHCVIYYYLEDDTLHIAEPKIENSGIPQGMFLKRHRATRTDGSSVQVSDLSIGANLDLYGRVFHIFDADAATREFYAQNNKPLDEAEIPLPDDFTKKNTVLTTSHHKLMFPAKQYMEARLGKQVDTVYTAVQQFLRNDNKVLRFYCVHTDLSIMGEKRPYILHYFLADDSVEVLEVKQPNSGRPPFAALLKRQPLPKNFEDNAPQLDRIGYGGRYFPDGRIRFYRPEDFGIGQFVHVYGRPLEIIGCDRFTQQFYVANFQAAPEDYPLLHVDDQPEIPLPRIAPPEYNGYGTEEDSLSSFLHLQPKVPKQDIKKFMENDGILLRFLARFSNPAPADAERVFVVIFYLSNDSVSIYEKLSRNSGFSSGKFLERNRVRNPATLEYFKASDFNVGVTIQVHSHVFELIDCDAYTKEFIVRNPQVWGSGN